MSGPTCLTYSSNISWNEPVFWNGYCGTPPEPPIPPTPQPVDYLYTYGSSNKERSKRKKLNYELYFRILDLHIVGRSSSIDKSISYKIAVNNVPKIAVAEFQKKESREAVNVDFLEKREIRQESPKVKTIEAKQTTSPILAQLIKKSRSAN